MSVPKWVQDAIFYQIFPDRFSNGDPANDPPNVVPWDTSPTTSNFFGGDLQGIIQKLDYLLDLGVNAIYLNPIFQSPSNHRYNTTDYYTIDPKLGKLEDFHALLAEAHQRGMRVILDGAFNHCSRGFFAFTDVLENGEQSPYRDWFHIIHYPVDAYSPGDAHDFVAWWRFKSLPKFNTDNPEVRRYLLSVARYWIKQGADGWRLDVPNEIDDDAFWAEFRAVVRAANPQAYILGEIWEIAPRWLDDRHFDGLMNYPLRTAVLEFLQGKIRAGAFGERVERLLAIYPRENVFAQYNTLGTHDTERILTLLGQSVRKVKLAFLFLFAYPGAPAVYYGDEVGVEGQKDPDCRRTIPWERAKWKGDLRAFVQRLAALRRQYASLRRGDLRGVFTSDSQNCYAFIRSLDNEHILVAMNPNRAGRTLPLPVSGLGWGSSQEVVDLLTGKTYSPAGGLLTIELAPYTGVWLAKK